MGDLRKSLLEMRRVLRPGGRMFILEFSQPARWFRPFYYFYLRRILPGLAQLVTGDRDAYVYLNETIEQFPNRDGLSTEIRAAGFTEVKATAMSFGIVALHEAVK
jgi:demethylmenaquinone methyltransferase/2-methoxy-6-polyprenyl-1,4-benzoquinol methylase